jgi:alkanesulfonate monooxygenase SsuD/methylene tetrahydromethanopterin reductase-like flavin-dependent oxidoreductase (luciferase family)
MKFGFITTEGGTFYREALEEAIYGEELGFDSVWLEEHHSIRNHYWPPKSSIEGFWWKPGKTPQISPTRSRVKW